MVEKERGFLRECFLYLFVFLNSLRGARKIVFFEGRRCCLLIILASQWANLPPAGSVDLNLLRFLTG